MKHFKAFVFLISFLFTFAAARDLPRAKTSNLDVKTIANPGVGGVPDTRPIGTGTFNGVFPGFYGGGFNGFSGGRIPGGSGFIPSFGGSIFPGGGGYRFPGFGAGGYPFPGYDVGGRRNCQFGCCQYIGYRCMMCCGY